MVVRQKVGRKRYIAFEIAGCEGNLTKGRLARAVEKKSAEQGDRCPFDIIFISEGRGIARTDQRNQRTIAALLNSFSMESDGLVLETLCTSGTMRSLKEKYFRRGMP